MAEPINSVIQTYTIDFASNNNFLFVKAVQGDGYNTRYVDLVLIENNKPYSMNKDSVNVVIRGTKPDGTMIFNTCEVPNNNTVRVSLSPQILAVSGKGNYEISIMSNSTNQVLTSFPFYIVVSPATLDASQFVSTNEFTLLVEKINEATEAAENANEAADNANTAADSANTAANKANTAASAANTAANKANTAATAANNAASAANQAAQSANNAATNATETANEAAQNAANVANTAAQNAKTQADYAKAQGDYAKSQGDKVQEAIEGALDLDNATPTSDGLMSKEDKAKLDGIATGATKVTVDSALSSSSTNPVQNKVINTALSGKVPTTRAVNGKALSSNITLTASDVGAATSGHTHAANTITAGTLGTGVVATNSTDYTTSRLRNIRFGTSVPSSLSNGEVFFVYE